MGKAESYESSFKAAIWCREHHPLRNTQRRPVQMTLHCENGEHYALQTFAARVADITDRDIKAASMESLLNQIEQHYYRQRACGELRVVAAYVWVQCLPVMLGKNNDGTGMLFVQGAFIPIIPTIG